MENWQKVSSIPNHCWDNWSKSEPSMSPSDSPSKLKQLQTLKNSLLNRVMSTILKQSQRFQELTCGDISFSIRAY